MTQDGNPMATPPGAAPRRRTADTTERTLEKVLAYVGAHRLADGDLLPAERGWAETLGVTRRELRGALASLELAGRIWRGVGQGTYLGNRPVKFAPTLRGLSRATSPTDVAEMRLMVEPSLVALAAMKASPEDLAELGRCARKNAASRTDAEWQQWDHRFHGLIAEATRNPAIIALMAAINGVRHTSALRAKADDQQTRSRFADEHRDIVDAMRARDAEAASNAMRRHLLNVQGRLHGSV